MRKPIQKMSSAHVYAKHIAPDSLLPITHLLMLVSCVLIFTNITTPLQTLAFIAAGFIVYLILRYTYLYYKYKTIERSLFNLYPNFKLDTNSGYMTIVNQSGKTQFFNKCPCRVRHWSTAADMKDAFNSGLIDGS